MDLLIQALQDPSRYDHPVERVELMETHISWVLLAGDYVYKIKKPLDLGFLDFRKLEDRHFYCQEELRLNRRLAPQLYLAVVKITGTEADPVIDGPGPAIEYAVKMKRFDQATRLDHVLERGELSPEHIDQLARRLADFHSKCAVATEDKEFGDPEVLIKPVEECFLQLRPLLFDQTQIEQLSQIEQWCRDEFNRKKAVFQRRKQSGFVRECHGDAHLANMILLDETPVLFDAIEFSERLRWIDVMNELAFAIMDLEDRQACLAGRQAPTYASRLLNHYLEWTGDYEGLSVLRFYRVYRALVRAKIAAIRLQQAGENGSEHDSLIEELSSYLQLALQTCAQPPLFLCITRGLSGSGKSLLARAARDELSAIGLRTDVERKRRFKLAVDESSEGPLKDKMYSAETSEWLYEYLATRAAACLENGYPVIIDGTFLKAEQRALCRAVALKCSVPFLILDIRASPATLRARVERRAQGGVDASEADERILAQQLAAYAAIEGCEIADVLSIDADQELTLQIPKILDKMRDRLYMS